MKNGTEEEYRLEINRNNFVRALYLAKKLTLPDKEITDVAQRALWQVAGIGRNFYATKKLAEELGLEKEELKNILMHMAEKEEESGNKKILGACYNYNNGRYIPFEKWLDRLLREWNKIKL